VTPAQIADRFAYHRATPQVTVEQHVVLAHNHPGSVEPSRADEFLTQTLKAALALVDVRVLDHLVVAGAEVCAFSERGLL
jgi:DNA repair protein RadC